MKVRLNLNDASMNSLLSHLNDACQSSDVKAGEKAAMELAFFTLVQSLGVLETMAYILAPTETFSARPSEVPSE